MRTPQMKGQNQGLILKSDGLEILEKQLMLKQRNVAKNPITDIK